MQMIVTHQAFRMLIGAMIFMSTIWTSLGMRQQIMPLHSGIFLRWAKEEVTSGITRALQLSHMRGCADWKIWTLIGIRCLHYFLN